MGIEGYGLNVDKKAEYPQLRQDNTSSAVIQDIPHFLIGHLRILYRVSDVSVAKLALYCRDIAGLVYDMASHGVPGHMRRLATRLCYSADIVPYLVN
jgi:hypothetical protein